MDYSVKNNEFPYKYFKDILNIKFNLKFNNILNNSQNMLYILNNPF